MHARSVSRCLLAARAPRWRFSRVCHLTIEFDCSSVRRARATDSALVGESVCRVQAWYAVVGARHVRATAWWVVPDAGCAFGDLRAGLSRRRHEQGSHAWACVLELELSSVVITLQSLLSLGGGVPLERSNPASKALQTDTQQRSKLTAKFDRAQLMNMLPEGTCTVYVHGGQRGRRVSNCRQASRISNQATLTRAAASPRPV
jgi:hypothetical protein